MNSQTCPSRRNTPRYLIEAAILAGLTVAVLVPWGCSHAPVSPVAIPTHNTFALPSGVVAHPGTGLPETEESQSGPLTIPIYLDPLDSVYAKKGTWSDFIDVDGGVIDMDVEGKRSYFFVPTEGVSEKTEIRITMYRRDDAFDRRITELHFEPKGLVFKGAAMLSLSTDLNDGEVLELAWWDPDAAKWLRSAESVVVGGYVTFPIFHFSDYRTTERVSLGGQRKDQ